MRVLLCMYDLFAGGAETQFRMIAEGILAKQDIELLLAFENLDHDKKGKCFELLKKWSVPYYDLAISTQHSLIDRIGLKTKLINLPKYRLKKKIENLLADAGKLDWVITYNYTFIPFVDIFHQFGCKILFSERNNGEWLLKIKGATGWVKKCDAVTCNSKYARDVLENQIGVNAEYIKNGINLEQYQYEPGHNSPTSLLTVARISPEKNQELLIRGLLSERMKDVKVVLCGGVSSEEYFQQIRALVEAGNLKSRVSMEGFQANMNQYYRRAGCVVLPSFYEGTPNAILEAYACGVPVIASRISMNEPLFRDKALLFDPNSVEEFITSYKYFRNLGKEKLQALVEENYEYVKTEYDVSKMRNSYLKILFRKR